MTVYIKVIYGAGLETVIQPSPLFVVSTLPNVAPIRILALSVANRTTPQVITEMTIIAEKITEMIIFAERIYHTTNRNSAKTKS